MIFKTIEKKNGDLKLGTNFGNNKDFFTRQNILSDSDIKAIKAYNAEIHACSGPQTAFMRTMMGASDKAKDMVAQANGNTVALGNLTRASKAASFGLKALSIAGNMLIMWGITEVISGAVKLFKSGITEFFDGEINVKDIKPLPIYV